MIKLGGLVNLKPLNEEGVFTATNKETGNVSVFKSKASRDAAVKSGSHEMRKDDKEDSVEKPSPKVNIFNKDKEQPKSTQKATPQKRSAINKDMQKMLKRKMNLTGDDWEKFGKKIEKDLEPEEYAEYERLRKAHDKAYWDYEKGVNDEDGNPIPRDVRWDREQAAQKAFWNYVDGLSKKQPKSEPKSQPSNSFSGNDIEDALEDSVQLDDFIDANEDKFSKEDWQSLKSLKGAIQALEGDITDAEMDDDEELMEEYEAELEEKREEVKTILNKYKTTSSKKSSSGTSSTLKKKLQNIVTQGKNGSLSINDFEKIGTEIADELPSEQKAEYDRLVGNMKKTKQDYYNSDKSSEEDTWNKYKKSIAEFYEYLDSISKPTENTSMKLKDLLPEAETFTATNKKSGKTVVFKSKDARDSAVKSGSHEMRKDDKAGDAKNDKGGVNIFKKAQEEPKSQSPEKNYGKNDSTKVLTDFATGKLSFDDLEKVVKHHNMGGSINVMDLDRTLTSPQTQAGLKKAADSVGMSVDDFKQKLSDLRDKLKAQEEPKKDGPVKDSSGGRAGNPQVNKATKKKAEELGITPSELGREEYEKTMVQAAVAALTDSNYHSEARQLIAMIEDKPEWKEDPRKSAPKIDSPEYDEWQKSSVYSSEYYDADSATEELGQTASQEAGWNGVDALDGIAFELKTRGFVELAKKIQSVIKENTSTRLKDLV